MNSTRDIVFKQCSCTDEKTGRQLAGRCPHLAEPRHGSWYYAVQVTTVGGRKARYRRGGFATRDTAAARQAILDAPAARPRQAHGRWLGGCGTGWRRPSRTCARRPRTATATTSTATSSPASAGSP